MLWLGCMSLSVRQVWMRAAYAMHIMGHLLVLSNAQEWTLTGSNKFWDTRRMCMNVVGLLKRAIPA